ncbi:hypothetical protein EXIGLDRAFT_702025, partial [Exidia glandulosa HHB12029]
MPPKQPPMGPPLSKATMPVVKVKAKAADLDPSQSQASDFDMELDGDDNETGSVMSQHTKSTSSGITTTRTMCGQEAKVQEDELDYSDVCVEDQFTSRFYAKLDAKFSLLCNAASNIKLHDIYFVESCGIFCYKSSPLTEVQVVFLMQVLPPVGANFRGNKPIGKLVIKYPIKKSIPELEEPDMMTVVTDMMYKTSSYVRDSLSGSGGDSGRKLTENIVPVAQAATTSAAALTSSKPASTAVWNLSDPSIMPGHNESLDVMH